MKKKIIFYLIFCSIHGFCQKMTTEKFIKDNNLKCISVEKNPKITEKLIEKTLFDFSKIDDALQVKKIKIVKDTIPEPNWEGNTLDNNSFDYGECFSVELEINNGKIYYGWVFPHIASSNKGELMMSHLTGLIHKILVDKDKNERVTELAFEYSQNHILDQNYIYYYLVNQKSYDKTKLPYNGLEIRDVYAPMVKSDFFNPYWDLLVKTNKLSHLSLNEAKTLGKFRKIWFNSNDVTDYLVYIPRLIIRSDFALYVDNCETEAMQCYIKDLAKIANVTFDNIIDKYDEEKEISTFGFTFKGKNYNLSYPSGEGKQEEKVIRLINRAFAENKIQGRIYSLNKNKETDLIFLTSSQVNDFKKSGLFEVYLF